MAAIYSNGGNRWNTLGFNFTKRDALSSACKISMALPQLGACELEQYEAKAHGNAFPLFNWGTSQAREYCKYLRVND
jgi:hypothetical protein